MGHLAHLVAVFTIFVYVYGHAHITTWSMGGVAAPGFEFWVNKNTHKLNSSWYSENGDNGFVQAKDITTPDIICHKAASPGTSHTQVAAGTKIVATWSKYADSHKGPLISYIASCNADCSTVTKTSLLWTKIQEAGFEGGWVSDKMQKNGFKTEVTIPSALKAGRYVLRHELIALHGAQNGNAQFYPQCINLQVTGGGSSTPAGGVVGTKLYQPKEPGVVFNLYTKFTSYPVPGPRLWKGMKI